MYEVELEFDGDGSGEFRPSINVIHAILGYVKRDDFEQAASLLAAANPAVGDRLIEDAKSGASKDLWKRLAKLFSDARDVGRAAYCAQETGDHELAAGFYEAAYDWAKAAQSYQQAGILPKAAEMHERGLAYDKAAASYLEAKDFLRAAHCYNKAGAYYHAGHLFMRVGRYEQAIEALQRVDRMQKWFVESSTLLGRFFEKTGNVSMAISRYVEVVRSKPIDADTVEVHHRLAKLLVAQGHPDKASQLWTGILKVDPNHKGALDSLEQQKGTSPCAPPLQLTPPGSTQTQEEPTPLVLPGDETADNSASPAPVTAMRSDFDILRSLPIFKQLSLDELQSVHVLADRVTAKQGEILIEQNQFGEFLFVIISGRVKVEVFSNGGEPIEVAILGKGASLGEMAMVDQAPTSASVTVVDEVSAFRFSIDRLNNHLATDARAGFKVMRVLGRILSTRLRETNRALASQSEG